ncbi:SGNH/GDSL hydrolase family protein [Phycicoccus sp. CSK15P-2]|uniref:SGNH/GDSL hydrolase family protein n=1 Tax=Phycicoccus sp. CSK15P-2 TaxID=2807627 RepID=UPI00195072EF|nr:SGNH/GDSL hydrolase family protein [Phycicoccus sp. CSK15P-2]MBM6405770.1 SGNH/GDSL hydrolase family protein [Phycicoccus sp. CSK15P-2]
MTPAAAVAALRDYGNRTGRPAGRTLRALGVLLPGVRRVQAQADPYADAWTRHNAESVAAPGRRWVVLGDSMSQSLGASAWDTGWVGRLARDLHDAGHPLTVVNLSATGARVRDVLDRQLPLALDLPATGSAPDLVTVLIGSNDLFAGGAARRGLPDAFGELVAALPRRAVMATLPQPRTAARRANVHLVRAGEQGHLEVVDMARDGPRSWHGRLAADRFHPNDRGYAAIAGAFQPAVLGALEG